VSSLDTLALGRLRNQRDAAGGFERINLLHFIVNLFLDRSSRLLIFVSRSPSFMARQSGKGYCPPNNHLRVESAPAADRVKQGEACLSRALGPGSLQPSPYGVSRSEDFPWPPVTDGPTRVSLGLTMDTRAGHIRNQDCRD